MQKLSKRLEHFKTGIFASLTLKRNELLAQNKKVYNLYVGTPDFEPNENIRNAVIEAAKNPENYKYSLIDSVEMLEAVKLTLEHTPPELAADVMEHGITLTGGGALIKGIDKLMASVTKIPAHVAEYPLDCVAIGTGKALDDIKKLIEKRNRELN